MHVTLYRAELAPPKVARLGTPHRNYAPLSSPTHQRASTVTTHAQRRQSPPEIVPLHTKILWRPIWRHRNDRSMSPIRTHGRPSAKGYVEATRHCSKVMAPSVAGIRARARTVVTAGLGPSLIGPAPQGFPGRPLRATPSEIPSYRAAHSPARARDPGASGMPPTLI